MNPERWQQIKNLFNRTIDLDAAARHAFLQQHAGDDPTLIAEVEQLLEQNEAAGDFLEKPVTDRISKVAIFTGGALTEGTLVGPFRVLKEIGSGGMGTVYLAEQRHPVVRQVALKMIRPGIVDKTVLSRFDSERQALAMMNHPHIAQIYHADATPDGRPYFAMEYVPGKWLTEYCDEKRLPLTERIELFLQACSALAHAHKKGIIHRDIKPSNVLVSEIQGEPMVKIIDFGIVKAKDPLTEELVRTQSDFILGTLTYVSPEQAGVTENPVGAYSDVYSLGILLYELVTGVSPFEVTPKTPFHVTMSLIRNMVPPLPSMWFNASEGKCIEVAHNRRAEPHALAGQIWGDLDSIIMKAMEKEPARRYASADELREDLLCYLAAKPVAAGHPNSSGQTAVASGFHKGWPAVALVSWVLLVMVFFAWQREGRAVREWRQVWQLERLSSEVAICMNRARGREQADLHKAGRFSSERIEKIAASLAALTGERRQAGWACLGRGLLATGDDRSLPDRLKQAGVVPTSGGLAYVTGIFLNQQLWREEMRAMLLDEDGAAATRLQMEARALLNHALTVGSGGPYYIDAILKLYEGDAEAALNAAEQANPQVNWFPGASLLVGDIHLARARRYLRLDQREEAERAWKRAEEAYDLAAEASPNDPNTLLRSAWLGLAAVKWDLRPRAQLETSIRSACKRASACGADSAELDFLSTCLDRLARLTAMTPSQGARPATSD